VEERTIDQHASEQRARIDSRNGAGCCERIAYGFIEALRSEHEYEDENDEVETRYLGSPDVEFAVDEVQQVACHACNSSSTELSRHVGWACTWC